MSHYPSRREILRRSLVCGLGGAGLAGLLGHEPAQAAVPGRYTDPRTPGNAKHVICLFLGGGPSQVDMFDPKPALLKYEGQRPGAVKIRTERVTGGLLPTPFKFQQYGESGITVSEMLPNLASVIDDICVIRSMYSFNPTHTPATSLWHTGSVLLNRPSMGAWVSYGLGSLNENLPSFVGLGGRGSALRTGFLPAVHQGAPFNNAEIDPVNMIPDLKNKWLDKGSQRRQLNAIQALNRKYGGSFGADEFLEGRIQSLESAYHMQFAALEAFDVRREPESIREEYGTGTVGRGCLLARRLVERGVRYIHVEDGRWDDHVSIEKNYRANCPAMDKAAAALIRDLKRRGLLDETIVVWGGEFGRTPVSESGTGRDHNPYGYTMWVAGGGFRGGLAYGATDEFGFKAIENRVSIHDLHATMLYALGMDHTKLTYRYAGRDFRLTDVFGEVVKDILS